LKTERFSNQLEIHGRKLREEIHAERSVYENVQSPVERMGEVDASILVQLESMP
jgi:hypothetical protein